MDVLSVIVVAAGGRVSEGESKTSVLPCQVGGTQPGHATKRLNTMPGSSQQDFHSVDGHM